MKRHLSLIVATAAAILMIVGSTIVQGRWTERWSPQVSEELQHFAAAMKAIPMSVGQWDGESRQQASKRELDAAGAVGSLTRSYRTPKTGNVTSVFMICGASRSVAVHTPEACYPGAGFRMEGEPVRITVQYGNGAKADFMTATFFKETPEGTQRLRVFWTWNAYGTWEAPDWPRVRFGGRTPLNKLYLIAPEPSPETADKSPALQFAQVFLPEVDRRLFPPAKPSPAATPSPAT